MYFFVFREKIYVVIIVVVKVENSVEIFSKEKVDFFGILKDDYYICDFEGGTKSPLNLMTTLMSYFSQDSTLSYELKGGALLCLVIGKY